MSSVFPVEQHDRGPGQLAHQVPHGVRLAHARRPVQQQPPLQVLAGGEQLLAVVRDPDDLPADRGHRRRGQDQVVERHRRPAVERQDGLPLAEHVPASERDDLAAVDVVLERRGPHPHRDGRGVRRVLGRDLEPARRAPHVRLAEAQQEHGAPLTFADQVDRAHDARAHLAVGPGRQIESRHAPGASAVVRLVPCGASARARSKWRCRKFVTPTNVWLRPGAASQASRPTCTLTCSYDGHVSSTTSRAGASVPRCSWIRVANVSWSSARGHPDDPSSGDPGQLGDVGEAQALVVRLSRTRSPPRRGQRPRPPPVRS